MTPNQLADQIEEALADQRVEGLDKFSIYGHRDDWTLVMKMLRGEATRESVLHTQALLRDLAWCDDFNEVGNPYLRQRLQRFSEWAKEILKKQEQERATSTQIIKEGK